MSITRTVQVEEVGFPWWLLLIQGIAGTLLGILLFVRPTTTMIVLIQFLGIYWLITGIFSTVSLIWDRSEWAWKLTSGILGILAGILIIQNLLWSTLILPATLALMLGGIGVIIGISQLIDAFRGSGIGVGILGAFSILLGFILMTRPVIAGFALPWILGSILIVGGILTIIAAFGTLYLDNLYNSSQAWMDSQAAVSPAEQVEASAWDISETIAEPDMEADFEYKTVSEAAVEGVAVAGMAVIGREKDEGEPEEEGEVSDIAVDEYEGEPAEVDEVSAIAVDESEGEPEEVGGVSAIAESESESIADLSDEITEEETVIEEPEVVLTGNVDPADLTEMAKFQHPLEYVEGIGPVYSEKLNAIGLANCLDLLKAGATRRGREEIAEKSGISGKLILEWVNHVDLYRIKGVGSEYADLLEDAGIDTVVELAQRNPTNLYEKLVEVNAEKNLVRQMPTHSQVVDWISQAQGLPRVVNY